MRAVTAAVVVVLAALVPAGPVAPAGGTVAADGSSSIGSGQPVAGTTSGGDSPPIGDPGSSARAANRSGVARENERPLAEAGLDQRATWGDPVYLDARGSRDPDGRIVAYEWTIETPNGSTVTPACRDCPRTMFRPNGTGRFAVTVTVTDEDGATASDTLYVNVSAGEPPGVRLAGPTDPRVDRPETYRVVTERGDPPVERVVLRRDGREVANRSVAGAGTHRVRVRFPSAGSYELNATAIDAAGQRANDTLAVTARDRAPDPGPDPPEDPGGSGPDNGTLTAAIDGPTEASVGASVTFDGSDSTAPNGSIESYEWAFGDGGLGEGSRVSHSYESPGTYEVRLTVSNGSATDTATHRITVSDGGCSDCGGGGGGNDAPRAVADANATARHLPNGSDTTARIAFDGTASTDPDGTVERYEWSFGDGERATGVRPTHGYDSPGTYTVTLTVTDDGGATDSDRVNVTVTEGSGPPPNEAPEARIEVSNATPTTGQRVSLDGTGSTDPDGDDGALSYEWELGNDSTTSGATASVAYEAADAYVVALTVTDEDGASDTATTTIAVTASNASDGDGGGGNGGTGPPTVEVVTSGVTFDAGTITVGSALCGVGAGGPSSPDGATVEDYCADQGRVPAGVTVTKVVVTSDLLNDSRTTEFGASAGRPQGPHTHEVGEVAQINDGEAVNQQIDVEVTYHYEWANGTESSVASASTTVSDPCGLGDICGGENSTGFRVELSGPPDVEIGKSFDLTAAPAGGNFSSGEYTYRWNRTVVGVSDTWTDPGGDGQMLDQDTSDDRFPKPGDDTTPPYDVDYAVAVVEPESEVGDPRTVADTTNVRVNGCLNNREWDSNVGKCMSGGDGNEGDKGSDGTNALPTVTVNLTNNPGGDGLAVPADSEVTFTAEVTDPDGNLDRLSYNWTADSKEAGGDDTYSHVFSDPGEHTVSVTVKDDSGATASDSLTVTVTDESSADPECPPECAEGGGDGSGGGSDGSGGNDGSDNDGDSGDECQAKSPNGDYCLVR